MRVFKQIWSNIWKIESNLVVVPRTSCIFPLSIFTSDWDFDITDDSTGLIILKIEKIINWQLNAWKKWSFFFFVKTIKNKNINYIIHIKLFIIILI